MTYYFRRLTFIFLATIAIVTSTLQNRALAQTYAIDCAILLCLSGGWPSSEPCARARAEFIRRIAPWPVEPPLQIWRCPMGASYHPDTNGGAATRLFDIYARNSAISLLKSRPPTPTTANANLLPRALEEHSGTSHPLPGRFMLHLVQNRADIDISGPEFNFVRSIRVFDVQFARQNESGRDGDCNRMAVVNLGTYGRQGEFSWQRSSPSALPSAHTGLERWGEFCPSIWHRSVFVEWRDYEGNYGYEQVHY